MWSYRTDPISIVSIVIIDIAVTIHIANISISITVDTIDIDRGKQSKETKNHLFL